MRLVCADAGGLTELVHVGAKDMDRLKASADIYGYPVYFATPDDGLPVVWPAPQDDYRIYLLVEQKVRP